jgi:hypothetical protein
MSSSSSSSSSSCASAPPLCVLVAGDASHCGKSSVSLGLLSVLLNDFAAAELAYIKPATQCVADTLVAKFCQTRGIAYVHIGPVVFYRGMTRECLDGTHPSGKELVAMCAAAVQAIGRGKRVVIVDGVGYPTVGSIVGCSSVDVAVACGAPVLLVGRPGVGDAVDAFNMCAAPFEIRGVTVLGGVFNKLPMSGQYCLEKCRHYVTKFFALHRPGQRCYGFLPISDTLTTLGTDAACAFAFKHPHPDRLEVTVPAMDAAETAVAEHLTQLFQQHVDVSAIIRDAVAATTTTTSATTATAVVLHQDQRP